jgi:preprotein translocase subunit SecY
MTTQLHPTQDENKAPTTFAPNPPNRWSRLAFTILPFLIYMLAERIPLPTVEYSKYGRVSPEAYSIVAVGIMPWIIAVVIVEITAAVVPDWRHLRHEGMMGRAKLRRTTNILGLVIAALHALAISISLAFTPTMVFVDPVNPQPLDVLFAELYPPEASSPPLVFVTLVVGAMLARLLAEVVSRRGLAHGYVVVYAGERLLSILRTIFRDKQLLEWPDMLKLSGNVFACIVMLLLFIVAKHRSSNGAIKRKASSEA